MESHETKQNLGLINTQSEYWRRSVSCSTKLVLISKQAAVDLDIFHPRSEPCFMLRRFVGACYQERGLLKTRNKHFKRNLRPTTKLHHAKRNMVMLKRDHILVIKTELISSELKFFGILNFFVILSSFTNSREINSAHISHQPIKSHKQQPMNRQT